MSCLPGLEAADDVGTAEQAELPQGVSRQTRGVSALADDDPPDVEGHCFRDPRDGHFMNVGFEKILLMQNNLNLDSSDVISTFVYSEGILKGEYSYTAAIGLFNSIINLALLLLVNRFARKKAETSLW